MTKLLCVSSSVPYFTVGKQYPVTNTDEDVDYYWINSDDGIDCVIELRMGCATFQVVTENVMRLFEIRYTKDNGSVKTYQIPALSIYDACVRLGQIYGDDKYYRDDVSIHVVEVV